MWATFVVSFLATMSKRMENMLDATLPPPPPVNDFMECLREVADGKAKPVEGDLFDGVFENEVDTVGKPAGTMGVHKTAVRLVLNFEALRALKGVELADLDVWFEQFAKFVIDVRTITQDEDQQKRILKKREEFSGDPKALRSISPLSMRTYVNGLAVMYNQSGRTTKVSFSSTMQFPKFNAFMRGCVTIHRGLVAIKEASKDAAAFEILQDRELPLLWNNTNFDSLYEVQRMGMAILAFRTGLRGDTLRKLDIDMYALIVEGGEKYLQPVVGTMKNLAASLDKVEKALFKQRVAQCEDHRFCAIWWFQKLASMSPLKTKGPLFHFLNPLSNSVQEGKRAGYGVCRGTANWVGQLLERPGLTMKDIGRRPVFTKLANSEVSLADAAKYLGVAQKTLAVYHRAALDTPIKAANLLSRYDVHEDETVSSNAKGPGLLDGDFLLEGTSLGIAENNAEVVAAIPEEVRNSQSSLCESLGSLREFVLVGAESPSKDVHASPASIRSSLGSLSGVSVDLLEEENSAESLKEDDSEWDYDERPLTQPSLKRSLEEAREIYRTATWEALPAPEGAAVNQAFSNVPQPFKRMRRPRYPPRHVPRENTCSKCSREIFVWRPLRGGARIQCKVCNAPYHESCFYATSSTSTMNVDDGVGPCCRE